jgi:hypothetical protein
MYDENQIVQVRWNNFNKEWYQSKGYIYTKNNDLFDVFVKDLTAHSDKKVNVICDYCGDEYITQYALITNGRKIIQKDCCSKCTGKKTSDVSKQKRAQKYINIAKQICDECEYILVTNVEDYTDVKMNIEFICPSHGNQIMTLDNLIHGHKCKECSYEYRGVNLRYDIKYIKEYIESINGNKLLNPEDYKDVSIRNLNIKCSCGNIFTTSFHNYKDCGVDTCYSCSRKESEGERDIRNFLELHNVEFVQEKRFVDCRDTKPLPFDFYLPNYNLCIEFDGGQHFEPKFGEEKFKITQKHDNIKNQYCIDNNISLLRIPYWEGSKVDEILIKQLNL